LRIERNVARIPIPASFAKPRLLQQLLNPQDAEYELVPYVPPTPQPRGRLLHTAAWAAAAVLLLGCGVYLGTLLSRVFDREEPSPQAQAPTVGPDKSPPRTFVGRLLDCDLRLAEADSPRKRVEALADLADAVHTETRAVMPAAAADDLSTLA